jgi:hypothetical protein
VFTTNFRNLSTGIGKNLLTSTRGNQVSGQIDQTSSRRNRFPTAQASTGTAIALSIDLHVTGFAGKPIGTTKHLIVKD